MSNNNSIKTIRLDLSYFGANYYGYQIQKNVPTIQGEIEEALKKIYNEKCVTQASGRTDTGVHAIHQVVSFKTKKNIPLEGLKKGLNALLSKNIRILNASYEDKKFHARFSPTKRSYLFIIYNSKICPPFIHNHVWWVRHKINLKNLKKSLKYLKGEHDFSSFCEKSDKTNHIRQLFKLKVKKKRNLIFITITGNSFLRRMIRVIVGSTVEISTKPNLNPNIIKQVLYAKDRSTNPFTTAPPFGLYFYHVHFPKKNAQNSKKIIQKNILNHFLF